MALLDQQAQEQLAEVANVASKASVGVLGGQLIFGYTINEFAAIVGMVIAVTQFSFWVYEKVQQYRKDKDDDNGCNL